MILTTTAHQQSNAAPHNNWPKTFLAHTLCLFQSNFENWISFYKTLVLGYHWYTQPDFKPQEQILLGPFLCPSLSQILIAARSCQKDPRTPRWWNIIGQGRWNVGHWSLPGSWRHSWNGQRRLMESLTAHIRGLEHISKASHFGRMVESWWKFFSSFEWQVCQQGRQWVKCQVCS